MEHAKIYVLVDPLMYSRAHAATAPAAAAAAALSPALPSRLDSDVREILEGDEPDDVKAKLYAMALKKFRVRVPVKYAEDLVDETEILESVPTNARYKAKRLLRIVKENPHLTWNERGELIHNQATIYGSSIVELFNDILRQKKVGETRPLGWREFSEGLGELGEINKDLVSNYDSWKVISQNKHRAPSVTQTPATVRAVRRKPRQSEITAEKRRRSRAIDRSYTRATSLVEY